MTPGARAGAGSEFRDGVEDMAKENTQSIITGIEEFILWALFRTIYDGRVVRKERVGRGTVVTDRQTTRYQPRMVKVRTRFWLAAELSGVKYRNNRRSTFFSILDGTMPAMVPFS